MPLDKIIASEWECHHDEIVWGYVDQNQTLPEVKEYMKNRYEFDKSFLTSIELHSLAQYKKRYAGYKNLGANDWMEIFEEVEKRQSLGKDSEVYLYGRLIEKARFERNKARYNPVARKGDKRRDAPKPVIGRGPRDRISIRTPRLRAASSASIAASLTDVNAGAAIGCSLPSPYFPMVPFGDAIQETTESDLEGYFVTMTPEVQYTDMLSSTDGGVSHAVMQSGWCESSVDFFRLIDFGNDNDGPPIPVWDCETIQTIPMMFHDDSWRNAMRLPFFQLLQNRDLISIRYGPSDISNTCLFRPPFHVGLGSDVQLGVRTNPDTPEVHSFLQAVWGHSLGSPDRNTVSSLISYLAPQVPEVAEGELAKTVKALFEPSGKHPLQCLFEITAFFASNNKLTVEQMRKFLEWVLHENHTASLEAFLRISTATTRAFSQRLVQAAVSLHKIHLLRSMFHARVDFQPAIKEAILLQDYDFVELLLSRTEKAVLSGESGGRLLVILGETNNVKAANILIENGTDVNFAFDYGFWESTTSLHVAVFSGKLDMTKFLLVKGVNANCVDSDGYTALSTAVPRFTYDGWEADQDEKSTYMDIINVLLEYDASTQCSVADENLIEYVSVRDKALYRLLLEKSDRTSSVLTVADILDAASNGLAALSRCLDRHKQRVTLKKLETALSKLVSRDYGELDTISVLLAAGVNPNTPTLDKRPLTSTRYWSESEAVAVSRLLIKAGADVNVPDLLCHAVRIGNLELLRIFLDAEVDLDLFGPQALITAIQRKYIEAVAILIDRGVDLRAFGDKLTPLQASASHRTLDFADYLVGRGKEQNIEAPELVNAPAWEYQGHTAIQAACISGDIEMVTWLLSQGAEVNAPPAACDGVTPLEAVMKSDAGIAEKAELIRILLHNGLEITKSDTQKSEGILHAIIKDGQTELLDILFKAKIDVNQRPGIKEGRTPLQLAAELGRLDIVRALLNYGADINARPAYQFGRTALQAAAATSSPNMELLEFLVENMADVNAAPGECGGITAIQGAAIAGNIPVVNFLVSKGACVHGRRAIKDGRTAIEGAAEHGRLDTVEFLLNFDKEGDSIHSSDIQRAIDLARKNNHFEVVNLLKDPSR
ncbi:ankyrin [Lentithecium fluviatile CBS 122367]|uniref:Ankyrin n=1 Tax=Lentithecium fluviatile CBS 122367 TaxID=1168545 RepID=A0A6G1J305_9PLEO|nr:ankyrin [Lentithecium fluviatile CBS 122367]